MEALDIEVAAEYLVIAATLVYLKSKSLLPAIPREKRTIARERFSIARQMEFVARTVRERGSVEFVALCRSFDRGKIIVTFLAILELIRQRRLTYEQAAPEETLVLLPFVALDVHAN
jgi:chromatin segregation and condensation protein Rec8/ScpA/Scc1 (kleisin family)